MNGFSFLERVGVASWLEHDSHRRTGRDRLEVVLREDKSATLMKVRKLLGGPPYEFWLDQRVARKFWKPEFKRIQEAQDERPVLLHEDGTHQWWRFKGKIYRDDERLTEEDVHALLTQSARKRQRQLERARAETRGEAAAAPSRESIPEAVRHEVWRRDQGRCVVCGTQERLEFDHIIPVSEGGSNTARNIELRCEYHNKDKGNRI